MNIMLGNLRTFEGLGDKGKIIELEAKLTVLGYRNEDNCEKASDKTQKFWHIYDMPRNIVFSTLTQDVIELLKSYSSNFNGQVGIMCEDIR